MSEQAAQHAEPHASAAGSAGATTACWRPEVESFVSHPCIKKQGFTERRHAGKDLQAMQNQAVSRDYKNTEADFQACVTHPGLSSANMTRLWKSQTKLLCNASDSSGTQKQSNAGTHNKTSYKTDCLDLIICHPFSHGLLAPGWGLLGWGLMLESYFLIGWQLRRSAGQKSRAQGELGLRRNSRPIQAKQCRATPPQKKKK